MQQFLSNGGLSKMLWILLMFLLSLGSIVILFTEIWNNQPINPIIMNILIGVLTHGATIGGHILSDQATQHVTGPLPPITPPASSTH